MIFCSLPAATVLLFAVFHLLDLKVRVMTAFQTPNDRDSMIEEFNNPTSGPIILIMTYVLGSTGLNLQKDCRRIHLIEIASNLGSLGQSLGRVRRFGNPYGVIYLYEYYVEGTFDDRNVWKAIEKAVPQAMAELNRQIFKGDNDEGTGAVDLGDWTLIDKKLMKVEDVDLAEGQEVVILTAHELLREILMMAKGEQVSL